MKHCGSCDRTLPFEEFSRNKAKKDGYQTVCKQCKKKYNKRYYKETKEIHNPKRYERRKNYRLELHSKMIEHLSSHPCVDCGIKDILVLEFDHLRDKSSGICEMIQRLRSWEAILAEIEKCDVVCANCHNKRTHIRNNSYRYKAALTQLVE